MKKIFIILVLLFPSSLIAETFKCQLEYQDVFGDTTSFELFIDTGDTNVGPIVLLDKNKNLKQIILPGIQSVGKVYSDNYPSAGQKISDDAYFFMVNSLLVHGFFVHIGRMVLIDIDLFDSDKISISISDPTHLAFSRDNSKGFCK